MANILEIKKLTKEFPGVKALDEVEFTVKEGEVHALVGENGAGKSTLMKVLCGLYPYGSYQGEVIVNGSTRQFKNIEHSENNGIAIIFQELMLFKDLSIAENVFVGDRLGEKGIINWNRMNGKTKELLEYIKLNESPETLVGHLGVGKQQMVEIMKALAKEAKILILDEPTAALTDVEVVKLLEIIKDLKGKGVTCIYISHRLNEVLEISDTVTILKDGKTVGTYVTKELDENKIVSKMVGREISQRYPKVCTDLGEVSFQVHNWTVKDYQNSERKVVDNVTFAVHKGEILGIAGLMGSGRTELVSSLFGIDVGAKYEIYTLMNKLLAEGMSIIMISSDLQEVLGMSHRVMVMKEGRVTGIIENKELTEEIIMKSALEV